jgi:RND family efflux transporter MFP subunit
LPEVNAVLAKDADSKTCLSLPGDIEPVQNVPIYARINGYLSKRFVDIGDHVKAGQLLAVIDTPEVDHQVQQAEANLRVAQSNLDSAYSDRKNYVAQVSAASATINKAKTDLDYSNTQIKRYQNLAAEGAVSWEQRDQWVKQNNADSATLQASEEDKNAKIAQVNSADSRIASAKQAVEANQAIVNQLKATQSFHKVIAPCDGIITEKFIDEGALVAAGGNTGTTQILSLAKTDVLQIYVDVPQTDYRYIHNGDKAKIVLQEFPGRSFEGKVTNIAGGLNSGSRTLHTELKIDNRSNILKPGSYAEVQFVYNNIDPPVVIPSNAAMTKTDGLYAAVVEGGKVRLKKIQVSRDYGSKMEISAGLKKNDVVILDLPDSLNDGSAVKATVSRKPSA